MGWKNGELGEKVGKKRAEKDRGRGGGVKKKEEESWRVRKGCEEGRGWRGGKGGEG